ncbi:helix-loop-helix DNA-binding domain-containing protein [Dichotomocladium elegans]|nr:helix-loop-helix DNA-binding domain-containing protein [Dichotomocladium elegans]
MKRKRTSSGNMDFWQLEPSQQIKKVAHNAIERRYRTNINDRINDLKNVVPALYKARVGDKDGDDGGDSDEDSGEQEVVDGIEVAKKLNKATILRKATEYILFLRRSNELADRENQILQHIIGQMPGGQQVLSEFMAQKREFHQREQERLARERKEARVREQIQRQELLKERAAQRAALAQLLPKRERRPYRRRKKSEDQQQQQQQNKKSAANNAKDQGSNRMFMALYLSVAFFSTSPFDRNGANANALHHSNHQNSRIVYSAANGDNGSAALSGSSLRSFFFSSSSWIWFQVFMYAIGFFYFFLLPWLNRPPRRTSKKQHHLHHHYAAEVVTSWNELYESVVQLVSMSRSSIGLVYETLYDLSFLPSLFASARVSKTELNDAAAWTRLCEMQCLGADPSLSRLQLLRSCAGMLSRIHLLKREHGLVTPHTLNRVHTAAAIQLELAFGKNPVSRHLVSRRPTDQVMAMLATRCGGGCPNVFYSFVLPYLVTPFDWTAYWEALGMLQSKYTQWIMMPSDNSIFDTTIASDSSAVPSMITWWTHLGACLVDNDNKVPAESLQYLEDLTEKDELCPSSSLLKRHCHSIYHLVKAVSESDRFVLAHHLEQGLADVSASVDCIKYLSPPVDTMSNAEADLLHLSTLAVHMFVYRRLLAFSADRSLDRFRDFLGAQISREMESKVVPDECREVIETVL